MSQHLLGRLLIAGSRHHEAAAAYGEALRLLPEQGMFNNDLAWLLVTAPDSKLQDPGKAARLAEKAVELRPKAANVWNTLGAARYRAGDYLGAIAALEKSEELGGGSEFGFNAFFMAMSHWRLGEPAEARRLFDQAVQWMENSRPSDDELRLFHSEASALLGLPQPCPLTSKKEMPPHARG